MNSMTASIGVNNTSSTSAGILLQLLCWCF